MAKEGRRWVDEVEVDALRAAVRYRRGLVHNHKIIQQRLHDQLNALAPGLSAPAAHVRSLALDQPSGQAVLACAAAFAGRAPTVRSLQTPATAGSAALTPSTGCNGGERVYRRRATPGSERSGWLATSPATRPCKPTSPL